MNKPIRTLVEEDCPICTLNILEVLSDDQIDDLVQMLADMDTSDPDVREALLEREAIHFENPIDETMDGDLGRYLVEQEIAFTWAWTQYANQGAGIEVYDPLEGSYTLQLYEEQIVLPLAEAIDPARVAKAQERLGWINAKIETLKTNKVVVFDGV